MDGSVKVIHGCADGIFDGIVGVTVARLKASLQGAFNIPNNAVAFVNGQRVASAHRLQGGSVLEFCQRKGQKGVDRLLTEAEIRSEYKGIPNRFFLKELPHLKSAVTNEEGEVLYLESDVDRKIRHIYCSTPNRLSPEEVSFNGRIYVLTARLERRLMQLLVDQHTVDIETAIEHLYGHGADFKENSLEQVVKRLSKSLLDQDGPGVGFIDGEVCFKE